VIHFGNSNIANRTLAILRWTFKRHNTDCAIYRKLHDTLTGSN